LRAIYPIDQPFEESDVGIEDMPLEKFGYESEGAARFAEFDFEFSPFFKVGCDRGTDRCLDRLVNEVSSKISIRPVDSLADPIRELQGPFKKRFNARPPHIHFEGIPFFKPLALDDDFHLVVKMGGAEPLKGEKIAGLTAKKFLDGPDGTPVEDPIVQQPDDIVAHFAVIDHPLFGFRYFK
jgi:hypothetical protein